MADKKKKANPTRIERPAKQVVYGQLSTVSAERKK